MEKELIEIIIQGISGGFTGYITNTYAINMLFKEYTTLKIGGVIKKTKGEFIESISELVERDIINHNTLIGELEKSEFRGHIEDFTQDLMGRFIYDNVGGLKIGDIHGIDLTIDNTNTRCKGYGIYHKKPENCKKPLLFCIPCQADFSCNYTVWFYIFS